MAFRTQIPVRFGDEDHAGIVYFPRFFHFFHCAFEDFFAAHGKRYKDVLDEEQTGWPAVHLETDFRLPIHFGDVLDVEIWLGSIGHKSATFVYRGRRAADGADVVEARITVACIDMGTFRAKPIPEEYRAMFTMHAAPPEDAGA